MPSLIRPAPSMAALSALESALASFRISTPTIGKRHASHQAQGRANGAKDGPGKRLGAKKTAGQYVVPGNIIFKQRGTSWFPGDNCFMVRKLRSVNDLMLTRTGPRPHSTRRRPRLREILPRSSPPPQPQIHRHSLRTTPDPPTSRKRSPATKVRNARIPNAPIIRRGRIRFDPPSHIRE